jgi:hypothetical protein
LLWVEQLHCHVTDWIAQISHCPRTTSAIIEKFWNPGYEFWKVFSVFGIRLYVRIRDKNGTCTRKKRGGRMTMELELAYVQAGWELE